MKSMSLLILGGALSGVVTKLEGGRCPGGACLGALVRGGQCLWANVIPLDVVP